MKRTAKWTIAALAAMVMATVAFAASPKFPSYLIMDGTMVTGVKNQKKLPAELIIPEGATAINYGAFHDCTSLVSVTIPNSVTEIGMSAFQGCTSLASMAIPASVTKIDYYAFKGCASLASVAIAKGVQSIGMAAFEDCASLKEIQFKGTKAQWKAIEGSKLVVIPGIIFCSDGNIGVEEVPEYLKMDGTVVTRSIGTVPENVVIPAGVEIIGEKAFKDCESLVSVVLPGTITEIGWSAFRGCVSLVSIVIPSSVTKISSYAFEDCTSLKEVQFGGTKAQWRALNGIKDVKVSLVRCTDGNIGVENIPEYLKIDGTIVTGYTGKVPANLVIPDGVEEIGWDSFRNCKSLASVTVPNSVTKIGSYALEGCISLKEIQFSGTMAQWKAIQGSNDLSIVCVRCSDGNIGVENIPEYLTMKGTVVTGHTDTLPANVVIPEGVTGIGEKAFRDSKSLVSVVVPGTVTEINSNAFSGCTLFKEIQFKGTLTQWNTIQGSDKVKAACIRCSDGYIGIENIPEYLKMDGTVITGYTGKVPANLVIPDGATGIKDDAFKNCSVIESVTIPGSVKEIGDSSSIPSSFGNVFSGCTYLKCVTIADGVKEIGSNAFKDCKSLANIAIPCSVEEIGWSAFKGCASLANVTITDGVKKIGGSVFSESKSLKSVSIPKSVTEIGVEAFSDCTSLTNVTIPEGVTEIGRYAFGDCTSLKSVTIPGSVKTITYGAFFGCTSLASVTIAEGITAIGNEAFKGCKSLVSVTIPSGVTTIGVDSFYGCASLKSVAIPRGVTTITENAFAYCTSLASITIPRSVTYIGKGAFAYCNPNLKIQYDGTKAQWNAIGYTQIKNVQCSDGAL